MPSTTTNNSTHNPVDKNVKRKLNETSPEYPNTTGATDLVGSVAVGDLMKMMEAVMENKLKNLSTKSDIEGIKIQIDDVNNKFEEIKKENESLKVQLEQMKNDRQKDHQQIQRIVNQGRKKNVIFKGIVKNGSPRTSAENVCRKVLKLNDVQINSARVLFTSDDKISVIAEMATERMADKIFQNLKNLAGSRIKVERDLNEERQLDRKLLMLVKTEILDIDKTHKVFVKNDSIKIGVNWMKWNRSHELMCGENTAQEILTDMYGDKLSTLTLSYESLLEKFNQSNQKN